MSIKFMICFIFLKIVSSSNSEEIIQPISIDLIERASDNFLNTNPLINDDIEQIQKPADITDRNITPESQTTSSDGDCQTDSNGVEDLTSSDDEIIQYVFKKAEEYKKIKNIAKGLGPDFLSYSLHSLVNYIQNIKSTEYKKESVNLRSRPPL